MALPEFNADGDLPPGVFRVTIEEVLTRFATGSESRQRAANTLKRIHQLARSTNHLNRIVVFGSFITKKPHPNDVDVILVMDDDFHLGQCDAESLLLFDHERAQRETNASVFWIRPGLLLGDSLADFIQRWQRKRDGGLRGILEVIND